MEKLTQQKCVPCEGDIEPMSPSQAKTLLSQIPTWQLNETATEISREFKFKGFYKTIAFVNAVAWVANQEGHHPDLEVGYDRCVVHYHTHAIAGLSQNDFICAAKIDRLVEN